MKARINTLRALAAGIVMAASAATASAATWSETYNPSDVYIGQPFTWTHDLTDNGFVPTVDTISSFTLTLRLYDDQILDFQETAFVNLPDSSFDKSFTVDTGNYSTGGTITGSYSLNAQGLLTVTLSATAGDFYFDKSTLTAEGTKGTSQVPEPGSLALAGLALAGLGLRRRTSAK